MKKEDFERLKAVCEKEGFGIQHFHTEETYHIWKKDIWDAVEFAEYIHSPMKNLSHFKIVRSDEQWLYMSDGSELFKHNCKPSTEQAYIEQLKKECFGKHNDKLESSKIDDSNMNGGRIRFEAGQGDSFQYRKDTDTLYWCGIPVYQSGKWATRVKERVKVEFDGGNLQSRQFYFIYGKDAESKMQEKGCFKVGEFLASKLEKYINGEIE